MKKYFLRSAKISLILVYLVILAGAFVRLTGSGMGCPDWPKCFGYYIPPTEEKELLYTSSKEYQKGQVIIKDKNLLVAREDFKAAQFKQNQWEKYTKHDYAIFNPFHTWVEYLNRLVGALAGLACLVTLFFSFGYWSENKRLILWNLFICFLMGFQAWLGKTVVDSELNPYKISTHMLVALLIVSIQLYVVYAAQNSLNVKKIENKFRTVLYVALGLTIVQIVLGVQVRETVDTVVELGLPKEAWIQNPKINFYIHRSFSILVLSVNVFLFFRNKKLSLGFAKMNWVAVFILLEILSGISMYYFNFPFGTQTIHIVMATILFGLQFYLVLENSKKQP